MRKHGCDSIEGLLQARDRFAGEVTGTEDLEELARSLKAKVASLEKEHKAICDELHLKRSKAAPSFASSVENHLHFLELDRAGFEVQLLPAAPGASGADAVSFLFAADGTRGMDVAKCASGGEISRIMLSLKAMMAKFEGMPTLIFDEIDTGVSGSVADKMGQMICEMGRSMQVMSITHLPQVAAKGNAHFVVSKQFDEATSRTSTSVRPVEGEERESLDDEIHLVIE